MKTILIPTDFSPAADNAMHYGARLAQVIGADVVLLHVYTIPVTVNEMPVMTISAEELKRAADEGLNRSREELVKQYPQLPVQIESRLGNPIDEVEEVCKVINPFVVVMGTHGASSLERTLFGSTALSAMRTLPIALFIIPDHYHFADLNSIVLATDLQYIDKLPVAQIIDIVQSLAAQLHVVHVYEEERKDQVAEEFVSRLQQVQPHFVAIRNENVTDGLQSYLKKENADVLIVLPHEHSWLERFFFKLHAERIARHVPIPVLSIRC